MLGEGHFEQGLQEAEFISSGSLLPGLTGGFSS